MGATEIRVLLDKKPHFQLSLAEYSQSILLKLNVKKKLFSSYDSHLSC